MMATGNFCQTCGSQLDPNARFCTNCGSPVLNQPPYVTKSPAPASQRSTSPLPTQASIRIPPGHVDRREIVGRKIKSPGMAAFLSFLIPGLGQAYTGDIGRGIGIFVIGIFLLITIIFVFGLILVPVWWIYGIYDAYQQALRHNQDLMKLV